MYKCSISFIIFNCMTKVVFSLSLSHGESLGNELRLLLFLNILHLHIFIVRVISA